MQTPIVEKTKVVSLTYTLRNEKGEIFEYSDLPVSYLHGGGNELFAKVEQALEGRGIGERVAVSLSPEEGFGPHDPNLTFTDDLENVPHELRHVGAQLEAENTKGETLSFTVTKITDKKLTIDANHPLAGQTVSFEVTIQDIRDATPDELRAGKAVPPTVQ